MQKDLQTNLSSRRSFSATLIGLFVLLQILLVAVAFIGGFLLHEWRYGNSSFFKEEFPLLDEAFQILADNAYAPLPEERKLEYGMIRGMLEAYDEPFTIFVEPPQHELETNQLQGKFGGIGVRIERDEQNIVYMYPLPDSPALKAGMREGDRLLAVESLVVTPETTTDEIQAAVRGPVGEKVRVIVGHSPDYQPVELSIERAEVPLPSVTWNLAPDEPRVGVVQVRIIANTTPAEVTKAIEEMQQRGAERFVIDVRNNGGGLVEAGVDTARIFLREGIVIEQQYRGEEVKQFTVSEPGEFADLPIAILVNGGTASAAEIFAGAIQGQQRAPVVGTHTYGKDTIQLVFSLSDGSSLHVTSAQWWVPGLKTKIGGNGLQPDVIVEDEGEGVALQKAIETVFAQ